MFIVRWVPLVNHYSVCCCSCTLRTGTLLIAILSLFGDIIEVMQSTSSLYYYNDNFEDSRSLFIYQQKRIRQELLEKLSEENTDSELAYADINEEVAPTIPPEALEGNFYEGDLKESDTGGSDDSNLSDAGISNDDAEGTDNGAVKNSDAVGGTTASAESDNKNIQGEYQKDYGEIDPGNEMYLHLADSRETIITRMFLGFIHIAACVSLLIGAWREKPQFMIPYILIQFVLVVIILLLVIVGCIILLFLSLFEAFVLLIIGGPIAALIAYLWAAVYTYYRTLTEDMLPPKDTQLQQLEYTKSEEEEAILNPEEIQKAYSQIEYNIQQNQPHAV